MIKIEKNPEGLVVLRLEGEVSTVDVRAASQAIESGLAGNERIGVVVDFAEFEDANADAVLADIKFEMSLLGEIDRFAKIAAITDKKWLKFAMEQAGQLLPSVDVRAFAAVDADKAATWAADFSQEKKRTHAFRRLPTTDDKVYAFEMNGTISGEEMPAVIQDVEDYLKDHEKVNMLVRVGQFGFDPAVLMQKGLFAMKMSALNKVERYAIVGGPAWLKSAVGVVGPMLPGFEVNSFAEDNETDAWNWVGARAA